MTKEIEETTVVSVVLLKCQYDSISDYVAKHPQLTLQDFIREAITKQCEALC